MLLISFGTRPDYLKIKSLLPLLESEGIAYKLLHIEENDTLLISEPHDIMKIYDISSDRITNINLNVLDQAENWFKEVRAVLVVGDSQSAFSMAVAAFTRRLKVIHLEAGLRTYDIHNPYPEEFNRRSISAMTSTHLCSTNQNAKNLTIEGIRNSKFVVGSNLLDKVSLDNTYETDIVFVSFNDSDRLKLWQDEIFKLSKSTPKLNYVYNDYKNEIENIKKSKIIITNEQYVQELASYLHKKVIVCRKVTERPESIWLNATMCKNPDYLSTAFWKILSKTLNDYICPYGDGKTSEKIIEILKKELE